MTPITFGGVFPLMCLLLPLYPVLMTGGAWLVLEGLLPTNKLRPVTNLVMGILIGGLTAWGQLEFTPVIQRTGFSQHFIVVTVGCGLFAGLMRLVYLEDIARRR